MKRFLPFLLATLLCFTLFSSAVSAALIVNKFTNDFSVSSPYDASLKVCSCENKGEPITVTNTGGFDASYTVSLLADQPWFSVPRQEFSLSPGASRTVLVYSEPPCGSIGMYQYSIKIASNFGRERLLTRTLDVKQCQNVFLTVDGPNASNLCQPLTFHAQLKNVAEFPDTYHLDLASFNDYATYQGGSQDSYLVPNEVKDINITITPPCSLYGHISIPFTISSEKNKVTEQRQQGVFIENQFDHEIVALTQDEVCSRIASTYTFGVKNLINVSNDYDVIITGPGFMNYEVKELHLAGLEQKNITVALDPAKGDEGTYTLRIRVVSKLGDIKKTRDVELDVFDCFAYSVGYVDLPKDGDAYTDTTCCGDKTYTLNVKNAGQTSEQYNIEVDGPTWFAPEEKTVSLEPGENRNVRIDARLPCTDDTYEIPIKVYLVKHPSISDTVVFKVNSQTQQTCHAVAIRTDTVRIDEEAKVVPFLLTHKGLEGGVYTVHLDGELYNGTLEREITLAPGEEKVLHFTTKANLTDYFDGKYQDTLSVTYAPLNITYKGQFWTRLVHVSWLTKAWRTVVGYNYAALPLCFWAAIVLLLVALAAVLWLIALLNGKGHALRTRTFRKTSVLVIRGLLIVALIVAIIALTLLPLPGRAVPSQQTNTTGVVFAWFENEQHTVDLSQYFADPDKDSLEYTASQPAHVGVAIEGAMATLTPELNWAGSERIVFTASDQKGGITDSPIIELRVVRRERLSFLQWLTRYCTQVVLTLACVVLLALLLIAFLVKPRHGVEHKPGQLPSDAKGKAVYTVVTKDGSVQALGTAQPTQAPKQARPKRKAPSSSSRSSSRALVAATPGQVFTYKDARGKTRTLGVAEPLVWPQQPAQKDSRSAAVSSGNTVNIAVGGSAAQATHQHELVLVGAKEGNKVHDPQCIIAQRIPRKNRVTFTNKRDALKAGYGPCKVCQSFDKA